MPTDGQRPSRAEEKARRRAARERVGAYHEACLRDLLEHVREGFARYDAGELDAFALDDLIHRYKRSTQELWKFCVGTGSRVEWAAGVLEHLEAEGDLPDWWEAGAPRRHRR